MQSRQNVCSQPSTMGSVTKVKHTGHSWVSSMRVQAAQECVSVPPQESVSRGEVTDSPGNAYQGRQAGSLYRECIAVLDQPYAFAPLHSPACTMQWPSNCRVHRICHLDSAVSGQRSTTAHVLHVLLGRPHYSHASQFQDTNPCDPRRGPCQCAPHRPWIRMSTTAGAHDIGHAGPAA